MCDCAHNTLILFMCPLDKTIHILRLLSVLLVRGCFTVVLMLLSGRPRSDQIVLYIIQDI